jgi:parallel beta-helix repeat protein
MQRFSALSALILSLVLSSGCVTAPDPRAAAGKTYCVDGAATSAADTNPGTEARPWQTIARAGKAPELKPGDTVLIKAGVYRESVAITVSGEPGKPITFEAAHGANVVIKGSEMIRGTWEEVAKAQDVKEPFPNAFKAVFRIKLGPEYFTDPRFSDTYRDKSKWYVSQVFLVDRKPLQKIGDDEVYKNGEFAQIRTVGRGLADMIDGSFYYDAASQYLYVRLPGHPSWYSMEIGVRGSVLSVSKAHDVIVRGLDCRHNRMPIRMWGMASVGECQRVRIENCTFELSDFCGLGVALSKDCVVSNCDASYNGNTGLTLHKTEDCLVENSRFTFNNYRRFSADWNCGGMKNCPSNVRSIIRGCEAAYNIETDGIWFDADNADIQVIGNVAHHNGREGIFYEINRGKVQPKDFPVNRGGGVIADNLVFGNAARGIYISGSSGIYVVHNTVADNIVGIAVMPREEPFAVNNNRVLNNLLIHNYITADTIAQGSDLTLFIYPPAEQATAGNFSDYNVYANNCWTPTFRHNWTDGNTLANWQKNYAMDLHSRLMPIPFERIGQGFKLLSTRGLDVAGPLPSECTWKSANPKRVGATRTQWP